MGKKADLVKKISKWIVIVFLFLWAASIFKCELLTKLHGSEISNGYLQTGMIDQCDYFRVLDYSARTAKVYYVEKGKNGFGDIVLFSKKDNQWILSDWKTVWSGKGSADGFLWPYLR